jgi:hypothetical protein
VGNNINDASRTARLTYTGDLNAAVTQALAQHITLTTANGVLPAGVLSNRARLLHARWCPHQLTALKQYNYTEPKESICSLTVKIANKKGRAFSPPFLFHRPFRSFTLLLPIPL